ncbi:D,D-heptose 1,7-bisphosphate phosphatase [Streptosporangium jomthongense]|uniref:D,D-heptose 1,7-bisphosphate phosphatase n=1 Tax=Marinobacter aromaticivorans TaxID=1494078 RepID=A0ABW2IYI1_9GAMM|nr:D-glycero-beta-D-manno-heptose 1,7-bisphosphate 7-phosphatase [Marinobacter aromaticivorans]GGE74750.1 D,D-heptose 1,7-bisphosphate phosphatase [Streptosporangium jomthongense]
MSRKAVFLDRDGVINVDHGYVYRPGEFEFIEGVFDACRHLHALGYLLIVVTNQSGIARGKYTEQDFRKLTEWMKDRFAREGAPLTHVYHCPHHPDYGNADERDCYCRKPMPGMIIAGLNDYGLTAEDCIMIGDKRADMEAASAAGIGKKVLVMSGHALSPADLDTADSVWQSIREATRAICQ